MKITNEMKARLLAELNYHQWSN